MASCTAINLVKHVKIVFVQVGVVCAAWWHLRELSQQSNNSCIPTALCTTNLDEDSFDMLCKNYCWAAIPDPIWTTNVSYERKIICYHPLITILCDFYFDFERIRIESRFTLKKKIISHCIPIIAQRLTATCINSWIRFLSCLYIEVPVTAKFRPTHVNPRSTTPWKGTCDIKHIMLIAMAGLIVILSYVMPRVLPSELAHWKYRIYVAPLSSRITWSYADSRASATTCMSHYQ